MNNSIFGRDDIPLGLGMALAQNSHAFNYFASLSEEQKHSIVEKTHNIGSKKEMQSFVDNLDNTSN